MAADDLMEIKAAITAGIERQFEALLAQMGLNDPAPFADPGLGGGAFMTDTAPTFATGYDGANTTVPFILDVSVLTNGSSGDILTG